MAVPLIPLCPPQAFQKVPGVSLVPLDLSEAAKVGGALSSCCVLLRARPAGRGRPDHAH